MRLTKEIEKLINKREKYGALANTYDCMVQEWCESHGVNISDITLDYGCMLITEPSSYADMTIKRIKEQ